MAEVKKTPQEQAQALKDALIALQNQNKELEQKLRTLDSALVRINLLFNVLTHKEVFPDEFITSVATEIQNLLTIPAKTEEATEE